MIFKFAIDLLRILVFRHIANKLGNDVAKVEDLPATGDEYEVMLMATNEAIAETQQEGVAPPQGRPLIMQGQ